MSMDEKQADEKKKKHPKTQNELARKQRNPIPGKTATVIGVEETGRFSLARLHEMV